MLLQARVEGTIGAFAASGIADLVIVEPGENGGVRVTVGDAKASRRDRPEHRIQVAFYARLIRQLAERAGVEIEEMTGCIWRVPQGPDDEQPAPFDLRAYEEAVELLADDESRVAQVAGGPREDARFHLTYKCDGCLYNALCMREAAEAESLALVPFMSMRDRGALERHGVTTRARARRAQGAAGEGRLHLAAAGRWPTRTLLAALAAEWPLGANLDLHVQRARAVARNWHTDVESLSWIHASGLRDAARARRRFPGSSRSSSTRSTTSSRTGMYLASALVVGPRGEREVIEITDGPPTEEAEAELVERWVTRLLDGGARGRRRRDARTSTSTSTTRTTRRSCSTRSAATSIGSPGCRTSSTC